MSSESFEHEYIQLFDEDQLKAKLATLKVDFDLTVARSITAGGGNQDYWSLLFRGKHRRDTWLFNALCSDLSEEEQGMLRGLKFQGHDSLRSVRREGIVLAEFYRLRSNYLVKLCRRRRQQNPNPATAAVTYIADGNDTLSGGNDTLSGDSDSDTLSGSVNPVADDSDTQSGGSHTDVSVGANAASTVGFGLAPIGNDDSFGNLSDGARDDDTTSTSSSSDSGSAKVRDYLCGRPGCTKPFNHQGSCSNAILLGKRKRRSNSTIPSTMYNIDA
jgi:hypothetical protein